MEIDFHNHFYPIEYVKEMEKRGKVHASINEKMYKVEERIKEMDLRGVWRPCPCGIWKKP